MKRRAEQVDRTRERITEAAVQLHTTVGPANTSIANVAAEAGVTRLTVYRHFKDLDALFEACMGHWSAAHPMPDPSAWLTIADRDARARSVLADMYDWYRSVGDDLFPIYRDWDAMPRSAQEGATRATDAVADDLTRDIDVASDDHGRRMTAVGRHVISFWTWRSLVVDGGLAQDEAVDIAAELFLSVAEPSV